MLDVLYPDVASDWATTGLTWGVRQSFCSIFNFHSLDTQHSQLLISFPFAWADQSLIVCSPAYAQATEPYAAKNLSHNHFIPKLLRQQDSSDVSGGYFRLSLTFFTLASILPVTFFKKSSMFFLSSSLRVCKHAFRNLM